MTTEPQPPADALRLTVPHDDPYRSRPGQVRTASGGHLVCDDTAYEYAVELSELASSGCVIWGRYSCGEGQPDEWVPNVSGRWLVQHLIGRLRDSGQETE